MLENNQESIQPPTLYWKDGLLQLKLMHCSECWTNEARMGSADPLPVLRVI